MDITRDILPRLIKNKKIYAYKTIEYIKDFGTEERIKTIKNDIKGKKVIIIINLIKCDVATCERSDFSYSAKIIRGAKAPGAAENIEVLFL